MRLAKTNKFSPPLPVSVENRIRFPDKTRRLSSYGDTTRRQAPTSGGKIHHLLQPITAKHLIWFVCVFITLACSVALMVNAEKPYRAFLIPLVLLIIFMGLWKFKLVVFTLIAYMPFNIAIQDMNSNSATGINPVNLMLLLVIVSWCKEQIIRRNDIQIRAPLTLPLGIFFLLALFSLFNGAGKTETTWVENIIDLKQWLTPMLLFFVVINCIDDLKDIKLLITLMGLAIIVVGCLSIKDYLRLGYDVDNRIDGLMGQANELGAFLAQYVFVFLGLALIGREAKIKKLFYFIVIGVGVIAMLLTFSRGAYIAFAVAFIAMVFFKSRLLAIPLVLIFYLLGMLFLPATVMERVSMTFEANDDVSAVKLESSAQSRMVIWQGALKMIADNPLFGVGYAAFPSVITDYIPERKDAHNMYLLIAGEMGLLSLAVFAWLFFRIIRNTVRTYKDTNDDFIKALAYGYIFCLVCVLIVNMFGSRLERAELTTFFWTIIAALSWARINLKANGEATC